MEFRVRHEGEEKGGARAGSVLVVVLAIILTMLVLGSLFLKLMGTETIMADNLVTRTQAIYLAESGVRQDQAAQRRGRAANLHLAQAADARRRDVVGDGVEVAVQQERGGILDDGYIFDEG